MLWQWHFPAMGQRVKMKKVKWPTVQFKIIYWLVPLSTPVSCSRTLPLNTLRTIVVIIHIYVIKVYFMLKWRQDALRGIRKEMSADPSAYFWQDSNANILFILYIQHFLYSIHRYNVKFIRWQWIFMLCEYFCKSWTVIINYLLGDFLKHYRH